LTSEIDKSIMRADLESASKSGTIRRTCERHSTDTRRHSEDFSGRKRWRHQFSSCEGFDWVQAVR
jgi:hypothetical protein